MKKTLAAAAALVVLTPSSLALAGSCGFASCGSAAFRSPGEIAYLANRDENAETMLWGRIASPFQSRVEVARPPVDIVWGDAPLMVPAPADDALVLASFDYGGGHVDEVSPAATETLLSSDALSGVAAAWTDDGHAFVLAATDAVSLHLLARAPAAPAGSRWTEIASGDARGCPVSALAVGVDPDGAPVGMCGAQPVMFAATASSLTVGGPLANDDVFTVAADHDANGRTVFYAGSNRVLRLSRDSGAWGADEIAVLDFSGAYEIAAAGDRLVAVTGATSTSTEALAILVSDGRSWRGGRVADAEDGARLSAAIAADGTLRVTAAALRLKLYENTGSGWVGRTLGPLGREEPLACDVGALDALPAAGPALLGALTLGLALLLRRRP